MQKKITLLLMVLLVIVLIAERFVNGKESEYVGYSVLEVIMLKTAEIFWIIVMPIVLCVVVCLKNEKMITAGIAIMLIASMVPFFITMYGDGIEGVFELSIIAVNSIYICVVVFAYFNRNHLYGFVVALVVCRALAMLLSGHLSLIVTYAKKINPDFLGIASIIAFHLIIILPVLCFEPKKELPEDNPELN